MTDVSLTGAFLAGIASFLSPCVLPLVPAYLSYISGVSASDLEKGRAKPWRTLLTTLLFGLGFSLVFVAMGAAATALGGFLQARIAFFSRLAGLLIILFGVHLTGLYRFRVLMTDRRYHGGTGGGPAGAFLLGMAFAFGWTPCVGPILFSILAVAATEETVWRGIALLAAYSAGLGIPFLAMGLSAGTAIPLLDRCKRHLRWIELGSGILLIVLGLLVLTGWIARVTAFLS